MSGKLTSFELKVLSAFASNSVDQLQQGAALNAAAECLIDGGYMGREGNLTDKGHEACGTTSPMKPKKPSPQTRAKG